MKLAVSLRTSSKKGRCYLLIYLHELYVDSLEKIFQENSVEMNVTLPHQFEEKIMKIFSNDIKGVHTP